MLNPYLTTRQRVVAARAPRAALLHHQLGRVRAGGVLGAGRGAAGGGVDRRGHSGHGTGAPCTRGPRHVPGPRALGQHAHRLHHRLVSQFTLSSISLFGYDLACNACLAFRNVVAKQFHCFGIPSDDADVLPLLGRGYVAPSLGDLRDPTPRRALDEQIQSLRKRHSTSSHRVHRAYFVQ